MSQMLDAIGGPGGPGGDPMGGPQGPDASSPTQSASDILTQIKGLIQDYIDTPESDEQETAQATKALVIVQGLLASEEKNNEAAMGTTPAHKAMAKQVNAIAGQVYGG